MHTTQERERLLDQVVPPAPRTARLAAVAIAMFLVAALATVGHATGAFAPSFLSGASDASWGPGPRGHGVELSFSLQSMRAMPVTIEGIDGTVPGLTHPRVSYATDTGGAEQAMSLPIRLSFNGPIEVMIVWAQLDCNHISTGERFDLPIHYHAELGWNETTSVGMLWKTRTVGTTRQATIDPLKETWPNSVSWAVCGQVVGAPTRLSDG